MIEIAAFVYTAFTAVVVAFQCALALGAPWGEYAMGGIHPGKYSTKLRVAAVAQGFLLTVTALVVLTRADLLFSEWKNIAEVAIWPVVALTTVSAILNYITTSRWERLLWAPVAIVLWVTSILVAVG